jgi:hypothetical protein
MLLFTLLLIPILSRDVPSVFAQRPKRPQSGAKPAQRNAPVKQGDRSVPPWLPAPLPKEVADQLYSDCSLHNDSEENWKYILDVLKQYEEVTRDTPYKGFSKQMLGVAEISYANRQEKGGWAGAFVQISFLVAAQDIVDNEDLWNSEVSYIDLSDMGNELGIVAGCYKLAGKLESNPGQIGLGDILSKSAELEVCLPLSLGYRHVRRHLTPAFKCYIENLLFTVAKSAPNDKRYSAVVNALLNLRKEHQLFIKNAVKPTFDTNRALDFAQQFGGKIMVSSKVEELRQETVREVLQELVGANLLKSEEVEKILNTQSDCSNCVF